MSVPPPGLASDARLGEPIRPSRQANDPAQYELKCVQTLRGRENATKAKWHNLGWECVSEDRGALRTELTFRRAKPKTLGAHLLGLVGAARSRPPAKQHVLAVACALVLVAGGAAVAVSAGGGGATSKTDVAQTPPPGAKPAAAQPAAASAAQPAVTSITVDDLVAKANAGQVKLGDQFRVTGELVRSDLWAPGASGDFIVMLKTAEGSDLQVFIDQSATTGWQDGTKVDMVLTSSEVTVNGETMDGFWKARSARTDAG